LLFEKRTELFSDNMLFNAVKSFFLMNILFNEVKSFFLMNNLLILRTCRTVSSFLLVENGCLVFGGIFILIGEDTNGVVFYLV
jgi:hypothetical protein